jgi:predicted AlkP superfamily phosphohydrolase/phosphomutase
MVGRTAESRHLIPSQGGLRNVPGDQAISEFLHLPERDVAPKLPKAKEGEVEKFWNHLTTKKRRSLIVGKPNFLK